MSGHAGNGSPSVRTVGTAMQETELQGELDTLVHRCDVEGIEEMCKI
jgi:hypothetical protein